MKSVPTSPHDEIRKSPLSRSPDLEDDSPIAIMAQLPQSPHKSEMDSTLVTLAKSLPDIHSALATLSSMPPSPPDSEKPANPPVEPVPSKKPDPFADMDFDKMIDNFFTSPPPSAKMEPPSQPQTPPAVSPPTNDDKDLETPTKPRHLFKSTSFYATVSFTSSLLTYRIQKNNLIYFPPFQKYLQAPLFHLTEFLSTHLPLNLF